MIPLYKPYMPDLAELDSILHSGALSFGKYGRLFEEKLSAFFLVEDLLVTNTFNTAISVALAACGVHPGDEVVMSPMACLASTQPYHSYGLNIVWADVDPQTGTLDPNDVLKRITPNTKVIIHNHFCGYAGYIDEINRIGREHGILVFDDGIECFGSEYKGKRIGSFGSDAAIFSFNPVRIPNTIDGGAVLFRNHAFYENAVLIRDCGIDRTRFRDTMGEINPECDISIPGISATMSDVNAYIGCRQMEQIPWILEKQRANAAGWSSVFSENNDAVPIDPMDSNPNYWVFGVLARKKREFILQMRERGYFASSVHINNNRYSIFGRYDSLPGVEDFFSKFVALPSGWWCEIG